jgi:hypothetical protein
MALKHVIVLDLNYWLLLKCGFGSIETAELITHVTRTWMETRKVKSR